MRPGDDIGRQLNRWVNVAALNRPPRGHAIIEDSALLQILETIKLPHLMPRKISSEIRRRSCMRIG
jgi:hypothetical protein